MRMLVSLVWAIVLKITLSIISRIKLTSLIIALWTINERNLWTLFCIFLLLFLESILNKRREFSLSFFISIEKIIELRSLIKSFAETRTLIELWSLIKLVFQSINKTVQPRSLSFSETSLWINSIWSFPLVIDMSESVCFLFAESSVSSTGHIFAFTLSYLFHWNLECLLLIFTTVVNTCSSVRITVFVFLQRRVCFVSKGFCIHTRIFGNFWELVLSFCFRFVLLTLLGFLMMPITQIHILFEFHQLFHFGFTFDSSNMFPQSNL